MKNDVFLADWMAGKISDDQLRQMVPPGDFAAYLKLRAATAHIRLSDTDNGPDAAFEAIKMRRKNAGRKPVRLYRYAAAATIALLIGLSVLLTWTEKISAGKIPEEFALADGSKVWLNAGAKAEFPKFFNFRRHVELQGEAYFEVSKGGTFTVSTNGGEVTVLGTRFNVAQGGHFFEVACFEGRVRVTAHGLEKILRPDRGIRFVGDSVEELGDFPQTPSWRGNESSFRSAPLAWVAQSLGQRYGVEIQCSASLQNVRFTGSFPHDDLDKALRTVCTPLQAGYKKMPGNKILIRR